MDALKRMEELQEKILQLSQSGNMDMAEYMQLASEMQSLAAEAQQQQIENLTEQQEGLHRQMLQELGFESDAEHEADFQAMLDTQRTQFLSGAAPDEEAQEMFQAAAEAAMGMAFDLFADDDEELDEEELAAFLEEHAPPPEFDKYMPIGALLIGTHDEPYGTLALLQDEDYTCSVLEGGWGIEDRDEALQMLASLMKGRHATAYAETFQALKSGRTDHLDEDDVEDYEAAAEAIVEVLELPQSLVDGCETLLAWDLERVGYLVRLFVNVEYITEAEAWEWMAKAAAEIKRHFRSWEEYIVSLLLGRSVCYGLHREPFAVAMDLLTDSREFLDNRPITDL